MQLKTYFCGLSNDSILKDVYFHATGILTNRDSIYVQENLSYAFMYLFIIFHENSVADYPSRLRVRDRENDSNKTVGSCNVDIFLVSSYTGNREATK